MNMLRAHIRVLNGWWEVKLLDLDITADGASEAEMLRQLEHSLVTEYHLAVKAGRTPFLDVLLAIPTDVQRSWEGGATNAEALNLPADVGMALAAALRAPKISSFALDRAAA